MNIISREYAYSFFPDLNFIKRTAYGINGDDDENYEISTNEISEAPAVKYRRRGWKWEKATARDDVRNMHSLQLKGRRRIGDSYTWSIPLDVHGVTPGKPTSVLQHSIFKAEQLPSPFGSSAPGQYIVHLVTMSCSVLRYEYTTSLTFHDPFSFWASVGQKLNNLEEAEHAKFPEDEWLMNYQLERQTWRPSASEFMGNEPEGWTFYDDQIPAWFEEYSREEAERVRPEKEGTGIEQMRPSNWVQTMIKWVREPRRR
jgi:hypothetical protein